MSLNICDPYQDYLELKEEKERNKQNITPRVYDGIPWKIWGFEFQGLAGSSAVYEIKKRKKKDAID